MTRIAALRSTVVLLSLHTVGCAHRNAAVPAVPNGETVPVAGWLAPAGPPSAPPARVAAGDQCIVDTTQAYDVTGDLTGTAEIDYRIFVDGECGEPAGTFDEHWIAHGTLRGSFDGAPATSHFSYTAQVRAGGAVDGRLVLGQGLRGELHIHGRFDDGRLAYDGRVRVEAGAGPGIQPVA